MTKARQSMKI